MQHGILLNPFARLFVTAFLLWQIYYDKMRMQDSTKTIKDSIILKKLNDE